MRSPGCLRNCASRAVCSFRNPSSGSGMPQSPAAGGENVEVGVGPAHRGLDASGAWRSTGLCDPRSPGKKSDGSHRAGPSAERTFSPASAWTAQLVVDGRESSDPPPRCAKARGRSIRCVRHGQHCRVGAIPSRKRGRPDRDRRVCRPRGPGEDGRRAERVRGHGAWGRVAGRRACGRRTAGSARHALRSAELRRADAAS